jgi:flagellar biosynthesis protein FlhG
LIRPVLEPRFFYVPGDACLPAATNPRFQKKRKLFHDLSKVKQSFVLLDLGAGSSITITDFFLCSPFSLLVMNPERAAELNAFNFLKNLVYRLLAPLARDNAGVARALEAFQQRQQGPGSKAMAGLLARLDTKFYQQVQGRLKNLHTKLVLNRLRNIDEFVQARQVQAWAGEDLGLNLEIMGFLPEDQAVIEAAHQGLPVMDLDPGAPFCRALALLGLKLGIWAGKSRQWQEYVNTKDSFTRTATEFARFFSSR